MLTNAFDLMFTEVSLGVPYDVTLNSIPMRSLVFPVSAIESKFPGLIINTELQVSAVSNLREVQFVSDTSEGSNYAFTDKLFCHFCPEELFVYQSYSEVLLDMISRAYCGENSTCTLFRSGLYVARLDVAGSTVKLKTATQPVEVIGEFRGKYAFLSNFYKAPVLYEGLTYICNEGAFQSAKVFTVVERLPFTTEDGRHAKGRGRKVQLRYDWKDIRTNVMYDICMSKFRDNANLKEKLLATGDAQLVEGNTWGDRIWGQVDWQGENRMGIVLMEVRRVLREGGVNT